MLQRRRVCRLLSLLLSVWYVAASQADTARDAMGYVVEDGLVNIRLDEFAYLYNNAPKNIQLQIATDPSARYEIIATTIASKRMFDRLMALSHSDGDDYFRFQFAMLAAAREYDERQFQRSLKIPDLEKITRERYRVSKHEFAQVPELRSISHILLLCSESCDPQSKEQEMVELRSRIISGESFADLAIEYSQDPGSKGRGGRLSNPISRDDERIDEAFREAAFALEQVGAISDVVESRFGFHVMRLEEIESEREYTYEEVKEELRAEVEKRYREDAYRNYLLTMGPTDALVIDYDKVDEIMGPLAD